MRRLSCGVLVAWYACSGCVDPKAEFDAFAARRQVSTDASVHDAGGDASTCTVHPGDLSGQYLFALSVTLAPTKPIVALANISTSAFQNGAGFAFDAQPLSAADRRSPVGPSISFGPTLIDETGSFRAELTGLQVTGAANAVTGGDIQANVLLAGNLCHAAQFFCGTVTGNVEKPLPLDLAGSTFTFTHVDSSGTPSIRPAIDCAGDLADPL